MMAILSFILSPIGRYAMIGLALLAAVAFIDRRATYRERAKCRAAEIQSRLDAANADLKAERDARVQDQKDAKDLALEKLKTDKDNEDLKIEIRKLPVVEQCIITPDRARRLQR